MHEPRLYLEFYLNGDLFAKRDWWTTYPKPGESVILSDRHFQCKHLVHKDRTMAIQYQCVEVYIVELR